MCCFLVLCPALSFSSVTAKVLKIMNPDFMQIFAMCAGFC